jgi:hypothetical protein
MDPRKKYSLLPSSTFRIAARLEKRPLGSSRGIAVLFLGPVDSLAGTRKRRDGDERRLSRFQKFQRLRVQCGEILERGWCFMFVGYD